MSQANKPTRTVLSAAVALALAGGATNAQEADDGGFEEITVTATKRQASAQDIPVAIQAMSGESMDELGVSTFQQYVKYLPNVTAQGRGPGRNEIYIRGVASEQSNNTVSSVQGSAPTVALYLDEQPVAFGGRNLDVYSADLNRVEVLPGPQGTLFGASSQAGTVRLITNKPSTDEFSASIKAGYSTTSGGDPSSNIEAMMNIPVSDNFALRAVVYNDTQGGWIDNVPASFNSDDAILLNVFNRNQVGADVAAGSPIAPTNNSGVVQDDWNDATYTGARFGALWDINEDWSLLLQHTQQDLDTDGAFEYGSTTGKSDQSQSFSPERNSDSFGLTTLTLEGRIGELDVVYAGGFLDREVDTLLDYTLYSWTGGYQYYYIANAGGIANNQIFDQRKQYLDDTRSDRVTHELRLQGELGERARFTIGLFADDTETQSEGQFQYFGSPAAGLDTGVRPRNLSSGIRSTAGRDAPTIFVNDFTRDEEQIAYFADVTFDVSDSFSLSAGIRSYDIDFALRGATGGSFGCRFVDPSTLPLSDDVVDVNERNSVAVTRPDGTLGCTNNGGNDVTRRFEALGPGTLESIETFFGGGAQDILDAINNGDLSINNLNNDGSSTQSDTIVRFTADWKVADDVMLFATFSEGFRPQTLNRNAASGASSSEAPFDTFRVPAVVETDELTNFEVGLKGDFFDSTLRLNATAYSSEIDNLQASRFDPSNIGILVFIENVGDAEVSGLDLDFIWLPTDRLTIQGAMSFVDSEITRLNDALVGIAAPEGSELPFTADFSYNLRARYEFGLDNFGGDAFLQGGIVYTGDSYTNVTADANFIEDQTQRIFGVGSGLKIQNYSGSFGAPGQVSGLITAPTSDTIDVGGETFFQAGRYIQEGYTLLNVSAGVIKDNWTAELFIDNVGDEDGIVNINTFEGMPKVSVTRPRTIGVRLSYDF